MASSMNPRDAYADAEIVVNVGRLGNDRAQVTAPRDAAAIVRRRADARTLCRRGGIGAIQEREIKIEPFDQSNRRAVLEALRAPFGGRGEVDNRAGNRLAEVEKRAHAEFLHGAIVTHRHGTACRLGERFRRADEHPDNLTRCAEVEPREIGTRRGTLRQRGEQLIRVDFDPVPGANQDQIRFRARQQYRPPETRR